MAEDETPSSSRVHVHGSVFGGGNKAGVLVNSEVNMSKGLVEGNVYGGGNLGDVGTHADKTPVSVGNYDWKDQDGNIITASTAANKMTGISQVNIIGGEIGLGSSETSEITKEHGNVFGGGKGEASTFECEKGMVYQTNVSINTSGTVVHGNVYGGGEVSRVEGNTVVTIGTASGSDVPTIEGSVFGAGAGLETHGYSALVRGTSTVIVQGKAHVIKNVYGGGEMASVGKYKVKTPANENDNDVPKTLPYGMPAHLIEGGKSTVTIQDNAEIGKESNGNGHVYGAGQGLEPRQNYDYVTDENYTGEGDYNIDDHKPRRMISGNTYEYFTGAAAYLQFVETLALSAETDVTISGSAIVRGSVFGGSESGFVYHDTDVKIQGGTIKHDAFGGGRGLESFAEAGRVRGNTELTISGTAVVEGNVYGGGNLGDVGTINKSDPSYNYVWKNSDSNGNINDTEKNNTAGNNDPSHDTSNNTGICTVTIKGGTIGSVSGETANHKSGHVFGAGKGSSTTWWCEKAIAYATVVSIEDGTVYGNVYGGGQVGRVEDDGKMTIGKENESGEGSKPDIKGDVFGAGAGLETHGYSALLRGNSDVTVQGIAKVGGNVYGGGEIASVGRFTVVKGLPTKPETGGICIVKVKGNATIGASGTTDHNVYGACKGVTPAYNNEVDNPKRSKSMQLLTNAPLDANLWSHYDGDENSPFIWRYYATEDDYLAFLPTLALTSHPHVIIAENATVNGSVFGGGERGITLGNVDVEITGGTVKKDVYGGGSLADTNKGNWDDKNSTWATDNFNNTTKTTTYNTDVALTGGVIVGNVYGGGLGQIGREYQAAVDADPEHGIEAQDEVTKLDDVKAKVYGDILVTLNGTKTVQTVEDKEVTSYLDECEVHGSIFGCNNQNGSPQNSVTVHIYKTKGYEGHMRTASDKLTSEAAADHTYELAAVYGGGDLSAFYPDLQATRDTVQTHVIIEGCDLTSIKTVYGGGNAAAAPATHVLVKSCYEIDKVFGGGNGEDEHITVNGEQKPNPGANVGYLNDGTTAYGTGEALAIIQGGTVHAAFGGSNTRGNIRESANATLDEIDPDGCPLCIDEVYGGGNDAYQDGTANIDLGCISYLKELYGGSKNADIDNDVVLNIVSGRFDRVFGGNNLGGTISGTITVNIEETGCHPIIIGQLYGGGNQAGYAAPSGQHGPTVNVKSFTSIGEIYGGGYGANADVTGDTYININECVGDKADVAINTDLKDKNDEYVLDSNNQRIKVSDHTGKWIHFVVGTKENETTHTVENVIETVWQPEHRGGEIGTIGNVFGGGNAADVDGSTHVNIGNLEYVEITNNIVAGVTDVRGYYILNNLNYIEITGNGNDPILATANTKYYKKVIGVNITGNVYGGGNAADVSGDTNVVIGKEVE